MNKLNCRVIKDTLQELSAILHQSILVDIKSLENEIILKIKRKCHEIEENKSIWSTVTVHNLLHYEISYHGYISREISYPIVLEHIRCKETENKTSIYFGSSESNICITTSNVYLIICDK